MIGVALVAFITVFAASAKASIATSVDKAMKSDWIVDTQFGMGGLSPAVTQRDRRAARDRCGHRRCGYVERRRSTARSTDVLGGRPGHVEQNVRVRRAQR